MPTSMLAIRLYAINGERQPFIGVADGQFDAEGALAAVFGVDAKTQRGPLRARLKHIQRLGLPGTAAGKGARISYSLEQASQWLIALLLSEVGIDPVVIVKTIQKNWRSSLARRVQEAVDAEVLSGKPILLSIRPRSMSGAWIGKKSPHFRTLPWIDAYRYSEHHHYLHAVGITVASPKLGAPALVEHSQASETLAIGAHLKRSSKELHPLENASTAKLAENEWLCTCNLTNAVRKLEAGLQAEK
jgi:hypothetical protein